MRGDFRWTFTSGTLLMASALMMVGTLVPSGLASAESTNALQYYADGAANSGVKLFLAEVNQDPTAIDCSAASPLTGQCQGATFNEWIPVPGTGQVAEYYMWDNPVVCFNQTCTGQPTPGAVPLYVEETVIGAAGPSPQSLVYDTQDAQLTPENGFLSRVWWSNYEATDPYLTGNPDADCTWDWANGYNGPVVGGTNPCSAVYFGPNDKVYGPIFSNDSIYVASGTTLGPVTTADPNCLFVTGTGGRAASCQTTAAGAGVSQSSGDAAASSYRAPKEAPPDTSDALEASAQAGGCVYQGPTTITFDANDQMTVWSPDSIGAPTTTSQCLPSSPATVNVPNGANGNGVIYVQSASSGCEAGANPYDDWTDGTYGPNAQLNYLGSYANYDGATANPDCEGDAFVSDNPGGETNTPLPSSTGGVSGQLTVATSNNVVVTGNVEYTDCGAGFSQSAPQNGPCQYNTGGTNDALGLIATNYVEVNHPVQNNTGNNGNDCRTSGGQHPVTTSAAANANSTLENNCTTGANGTVGTPAAAVCTPGGTSGGTPGSSNNLIIDAAILALNHSFAVNNEGEIDSNGNGWGAGSLLGTLTVYGSIDQDWRGAVGEVGVSGYTKDYDWDSRLDFVAPPSYLTPGTPSFALLSSLTLSKSTTSPVYSSVGQSIPYSYLVTNTGTTALTGVSVSDDLVPTVSCPSTTLAPGANESCTGSYTITQGDLDQGSVTNVAVASATGPESINSNSSTVTVSSNLGASSPASITSISPSSGPPAGGTVVTITGVNFTGVTGSSGVSFGGVAASAYTVNSDTSITATVPAGSAGSVNVVIDAPGGLGTLTNGYTYVTSPTVTSVSPDTGPTGGGTVVTIAGTGFTGATAVDFGASPATSFTVNSDTSITATDPAGSAGVVDTTVTTLVGTSATSAADQFVYTIPAPTVNSVNPGVGPTSGGTVVTIAGAAFTGTTGSNGVTFGGVDATSYTVNSDTSITATTPAGSAGTVDVVVNTPGGVGTLPNGYTYYVASLSLAKSTNSIGYGAAGQTIPYSYLVTNTGTVTLTGVGVADNMNTVSCPSDTLTAGSNETCTGSYTVTQADVDADSVTNTANAVATGPQKVTSSPSTVTVLASSAISSMDLTVSTTSTGYGSAGQMIPYSYLVTNIGTTTLTGISVSSNLSAVTCPSGPLAPGTNETCIGTYTVTQGDVDAGSVTNTATATGNHGTVVASAESSVAVLASNCQPPLFTSASSATAVVGSAFSFTVRTCSASVPVIKGSHLPPGLSLVNNGNGTATFSGAPAAHDGGIYNATVTASVRYQPIVTQSLAITVDNTPVFKSKSRDTVHTGTAFSYPVTTAYGYPTPTITTTSTLPAGVSLTENHNGTAALTGTPGPLAGGVYPLTITATNGVGAPVTQAFTLTVYQAPQITSAASDTIAGGVAMTPFTVTDTGYPLPRLKASGLPSGLHLTDNLNLTGTIAGTSKASAAGTYHVTISATGKTGAISRAFLLTVASDSPDGQAQVDLAGAIAAAEKLYTNMASFGFATTTAVSALQALDPSLTFVTGGTGPVQHSIAVQTSPDGLIIILATWSPTTRCWYAEINNEPYPSSDGLTSAASEMGLSYNEAAASVSQTSCNASVIPANGLGWSSSYPLPQ